MSAPRQPRDPTIVAPLSILGIIGFIALCLGGATVAAGAAAQDGFDTPGFGNEMISALADGGLDSVIGPSGSAFLFWLVFAAIVVPSVALVVTIVWLILRSLRTSGTPKGSLAKRRDYDDMAGKGARSRARQLRPGIPKQTINGGHIGLRIGKLSNVELYASHEDVVLEICGPRSNKTSALVVPAILSAPGPVITTSNKVDVWTLTSTMRARVGRLFVFDPQNIARVPQTWWWNPLRLLGDMSDSQMLAQHFIATVGGDSERADPYFTPGAQRLLAQHMLAAARGGRSMRDVMVWLSQRSEEPVHILNDAGLIAVGGALAATLEAPPEQRGGLYETALTALSCLESEAVTRYITPPHTWSEPVDPAQVLEFDPWQFFAGYAVDQLGRPSPTDTLYLLTKEGAGTGAPVCAAMVDRLLKTASEVAAARGGRIEPPVRAVLDEAANICPIKDLPDLYSYFGSQSIQAITILQSREQGNHVWTKTGMAKLWAAATVKLVGAGVHDPELCEDVSKLVGDHEVDNFSVSRGQGGPQRTYATRTDRILSAADVAALPKTKAVLISSGKKPGLIDLLPWYQEDDAKQISQYAKVATDEVRRAAVSALGDDNPIGQVISAELTPAGAR